MNTNLAVTEGSFVGDVGEFLQHLTANVKILQGSQNKEEDLLKDLLFVDKASNVQLLKKFARCDRIV